MGHPVECVHCAPTLIENMYEHIMHNGGDFSPLVHLKILQPGGAPLATNIVKALTSKGVNVKTTYGSTEIGPPFRSIPDNCDNLNCYTFRNLYPDDPFLKMEEVEDGVFELAVYNGFELAADLWNGENDNEPYRTGDLFTQDPPGSGFLCFKGGRTTLLSTQMERRPMLFHFSLTFKVLRKSSIKSSPWDNRDLMFVSWWRSMRIMTHLVP